MDGVCVGFCIVHMRVRMLDGFTIAVIIAAIVNIILGAFWYNPNIFGRTWAFAHGFREDAIKGSITSYVGAFIIAFVTAYVLGMVLKQLNADSIVKSITFAFWIWLGFIATTHFSGVLWAKKPIQAYLIDILFYLVSFEAMALIFALFA